MAATGPYSHDDALVHVTSCWDDTFRLLKKSVIGILKSYIDKNKEVESSWCEQAKTMKSALYEKNYQRDRVGFYDLCDWVEKELTQFVATGSWAASYLPGASLVMGALGIGSSLKQQIEQILAIYKARVIDRNFVLHDLSEGKVALLSQGVYGKKLSSKTAWDFISSDSKRLISDLFNAGEFEEFLNTYHPLCPLSATDEASFESLKEHLEAGGSCSQRPKYR